MPDLDMEEMNRIRLAMGAAALPVPGAAAQPVATASGNDEDTIESRQALAGDNWQKMQAEEQAKKRREERNAAIKKERERVARFAKLEGKGLADMAEGEDDISWLKGMGKRQKKIKEAEQKRLEREERERQAREARQYTEADLAGVKVGHDLSQFEDGMDQILVLKDTAVDADEDDELEAVALRDNERLQEKLGLKKRKRAYDPNDDENTPILAQYDEEIEGKKRSAFTLDGQGRTVEQKQAEASGVAKFQRPTISLDLAKDITPANDYMDISEIKIKKPKKKKSKETKVTKRKRKDEDEEEGTARTISTNDHMEVDAAETVVPKKVKRQRDESGAGDDDDLQAEVNARRRQALKKRQQMRPENVARELREEATLAAATPDMMETEEAPVEVDNLFVMDETKRFLQELGEAVKEDDSDDEARRQAMRIAHPTPSIEPPQSQEPEVDEDADVVMAESYAEAAEAEERSAARAKSAELTINGLDEEKTVDQGVAATLALLKQRGVLADSAGTGSQKNILLRERQQFLADKKKVEAEAERYRKQQLDRERQSARWQHMTAKEKEEWSQRNNQAADQAESHRLAEVFKREYKPTFELTHTDEHGRQLNEKEAFKLLSHQFHGKGSGNTKTKKHLDKIAAERRKLEQSSLETKSTGGLTSALNHESKKKSLAGVRLQ